MTDTTAIVNLSLESFQLNVESVIIWFICTVPPILFLGYYLKNFRKKVKVHKARHTEAKLLGADKAPAMFPQFDLSLCIGCTSCTTVCPMGKVLGMVDGFPTVINGAKCIGIAKCAEACPVGAVTMGLGNLKKRNDIPVMDAHNETSLSGVYIAGELGGQGLIFNGINQGKMVVNAIHRKINENEAESVGDDVYDIAIVGAGPAGIGASTMATQLQLNYVMLDMRGLGGTVAMYPKQKPTLIDKVEIPGYGTLDKYEYPKEELMEIFEKIHKDQNLNLRVGFKMERLENQGGVYAITSEKGDVVKAKYVILAMGRSGTPRKLGVLGEELEKVEYRLADPEEHKNKHIVVVGGGDSAIEAAMALASIDGNKVQLSYRKNKIFRIKELNQTRLEEMVSSKMLDLVLESEVKEIKEKEIYLKHKEEEKVFPNDAVFIFAGGVPPFKLLSNIGVKFHGT